MQHFNPLPLYRGRPLAWIHESNQVYYFNPLPLYRGRHFRNILWTSLLIISIHFLYTEEDPRACQRAGIRSISIHFLYTEEDFDIHSHSSPFCISIHFLYTEEDALIAAIILLWNISIHFLYTEEDREYCHIVFQVWYFNPLPLYRGRQEKSVC